MHRIVLALFAVLAAIEARAAGVRIDSVQVHEGTCDAAGAVAFPEGSFGERFLMVNNEDSSLRIYAVGQPTAPGGTNVGEPLGMSFEGSHDGIDIEAATWLGGEAILVGSHARNDDGEVQGARWQFLSVAVNDSGEMATVTAPARSSDRLLAALAALGPDFAQAIGDLERDDPDLAPGKGGINLEGMSAAADGASLFLGFRNPVPNDRALLVKLLNPKAFLFRDAAPYFATPDRLDLGGRGIRSMEYSPAAGAYFIVAGPAGSEGDFDIYRWVEGDVPVPIPGAVEALASLGNFAPEGLIIDQTGTRLQLFSDNQACETDTFRSAILTLE